MTTNGMNDPGDASTDATPAGKSCSPISDADGGLSGRCAGDAQVAGAAGASCAGDAEAASAPSKGKWLGLSDKVRSAIEWACPPFPPDLAGEYDVFKAASRQHFSRVMGPVAVVAQVILGFVLGSGWATSVDRFHRVNNCITLVFFGGGITLVASTRIRNPKRFLDVGTLLCAVHFALYQSMSFGRTAWLLAVPGHEQSVSSEAKILMYLACVMTGMLFAPVDLVVHAVVLFGIPSIFFSEALICGSAFDGPSLTQAAFCLYTIGMNTFLSARRHEMETRELFLDTRWQRGRVAEISDMLTATFDACCLIDAQTTVVLESNPKLDHLFQQPMKGQGLSAFIADNQERTRLSEYLRKRQDQGTHPIPMRFVGAAGPFEASVIATMFATLESRRAQHKGLFIGIQVSSSITLESAPATKYEDEKALEDYDKAVRSRGTGSDRYMERMAASRGPGQDGMPNDAAQGDRQSVVSFNFSMRSSQKSSLAYSVSAASSCGGWGCEEREDRRPPRFDKSLQEASAAAASDSSDGFSHGRVSKAALKKLMTKHTRPLRLWHADFTETPARTRLASIIAALEKWNTRRKPEAKCCALHGAVNSAAAALETVSTWPCSESWFSSVSWQCASCGVLNGDGDEECNFCCQDRDEGSSEGSEGGGDRESKETRAEPAKK